MTPTLNTATLSASTTLTPSLSGAQARATGADSDAKMLKAGKDFESILLGSWLQQAEQSFAKVPGGEEEGDDDPGKDQFQGIAMQAMAGSLTASGGIGIAHMITAHLRASASKTSADSASTDSASADSAKGAQTVSSHTHYSQRTGSQATPAVTDHGSF